jgi:hypothetical protein
MRAVHARRLQSHSLSWSKHTHGERFVKRTGSKNWHLRSAASQGACLAEALGCSASRETLLRLLRSKLLPPFPTPRVLGIDEWAWRKGRTYGTILVDLDRHCPVDLLPDCSVASVEAWRHPLIPASKLSAEIAQNCLRKPLQGGLLKRFRWPTVGTFCKNLTEAVEEVLKQHRSVLRHLGDEDPDTSTTEGQVSPLAPQAIRPLPSRHAEQGQYEKRKARSECYEQVLALHQQGLTLAWGNRGSCRGQSKDRVAISSRSQFPRTQT